MGNNYLDKLRSTVMDQKWLEGLYSAQKDEQVSKIKGVFVSVSENNNMSAKDKAELETQAEAYAKKVEVLEAKMAVLLEQIEKNEEEVSEKAQEVTNLITASENATKTYENEFNKWVQDAIITVMKDKNIETDEKKYYIQERIRGFDPKYERAINSALSKLEAKQGEVDGLLGNIDQLVAQRNILDKQYGSTKSIYELLNANAQQIQTMSSDYTNADTDAVRPTYSLEKTSIVQNIFETDAYSAEATNGSKKEGTSAPTLDSVKEKYKDQIEKGKTSSKNCDIYSVDNQSVKALKEAVDGGMLDELRYAGLDAKGIAEFLVENFSGAGFKMDENGSLSIPKGHRSSKEKKAGKSHAQSEGRAIFNSVKSFFDNYSTDFMGVENTWSDAGNTMKSNEQVAALGKFVDDGVIDTLANGNPAFTFKEAMYALFNSETGLFKDSGVTYKLDDQTGEPKYFIQLAGDEETANMYKNLSDQIYDAWGVRPNVGAEYSVSEHDGDEYEYDQHDPLSFMKDGSQYSFVIDKDNNGTFNGIEEFVGGEWNKENPNEKSWLHDLKSIDADNDNVISGDELKNLKLLRSTYADNAETWKDESDKFLRGETTEIDHGFVDAASLGITEINLKGFYNEDGTMKTELVNNSTGKYDINGSELFNLKDEDGKSLLNVKFDDGTSVDVKRQDETSKLMKTIYAGALGQDFEISFNDENNVDNVLNKNYGEFEDFDSKFTAFFANISILKGIGTAVSNAKEVFKKMVEELQASAEAKINKAVFENLGKERGGLYQFNNYAGEIQAYAVANGLEYDPEVAAGIFVRTSKSSYSPEKIATECHEVLTKAENNDMDALSMALSAIKTCCQDGINYSDEISASTILGWIKNGEVDSADEIVKKLKNEYAVEDEYDYNVEDVDVNYQSPREKEIMDAFVEAFNSAELGIEDDNDAAVVKALACLCKEEMDNPEFQMSDKTGAELAKEILEKYRNVILG